MSSLIVRNSAEFYENLTEAAQRDCGSVVDHDDLLASDRIEPRSGAIAVSVGVEVSP